MQRPSLIRRFLAALAAWALALLMATWRKRLVVEPSARAALDARGPVVAGFWHDSIPAALMAGRALCASAMVSDSDDGRLLSVVLRRLGLGVVPGSSGTAARGARGFRAARALLEAGGGPLALALDGSRGPAREAREGILALARHAGATVLAVGCACGPAWRLKSWDRTRIPLPFARVVVVVGGPVEAGDAGTLVRCMETTEARAAALIERRAG